MSPSRFVLAFSMAFSLCLPTGAAFAETATPQYDRAKHDTRLDKSAEGWYWYNDPERVKELTELLKRLPPPPPDTKTDTEKTDADYAKENPFSVQWVRVMLPKYRDIAWNNPTPENVQAYFLVQKFALDRSQEFANTARKVVMGNIFLDGSINRPLSAAGVQMADAETAEKKNELLKILSKRIGLFFFYRSTCPHCERQAPVVSMLEKNLGYNVIAISTDGGALKGATLGKTKVDSGQAKHLGVASVPAIYLMNEKGEFDLISNSLISYDNLKDRILIAAERQGWISEADSAKIHFRINTDIRNNLSKEVLSLKDALPKEASHAKDGFIDPKVLVSLLTKNTNPLPYSTSGSVTTEEFSEHFSDDH